LKINFNTVPPFYICVFQAVFLSGFHKLDVSENNIFYSFLFIAGIRLCAVTWWRRLHFGRLKM